MTLNNTSSSRKILFIAGPTSTGKTKLALDIANSTPALLISADSRQVFREMDIVTGKDHPADINISCIDLVTPSSNFSVSDWLKCAKSTLKVAWDADRLPIVVGGTGLYFQALEKGLDTANIPPSPKLRSDLQKLPLPALQLRLRELDPEKWNSMNRSDRSNPRRLIRGIEIKNSNLAGRKDNGVRANYLKYAIIPSENHDSLIRTRVLNRINSGAIQEAKNIFAKYGTHNHSTSGIGYPEIYSLIEGRITMEELVRAWTSAERQYAKRQLTWFKKQTGFRWITQNDFPSVVNEVKTWYHNRGKHATNDKKN